MALQYIIIGAVLLACAAWAAHCVYRTLTDAGSACRGCQLKDACRKHGRATLRHAADCDRHTPQAG